MGYLDREVVEHLDHSPARKADPLAVSSVAQVLVWAGEWRPAVLGHSTAAVEPAERRMAGHCTAAAAAAAGQTAGTGSLHMRVFQWVFVPRATTGVHSPSHFRKGDVPRRALTLLFHFDVGTFKRVCSIPQTRVSAM